MFVAKRAGKICGMLIASVDQLPFSRRKSATDVIFAADAGGELLLDAFLAWAKAKRVARVDMGVSQDDNRAMDVLYRRKGLIRTGGMYMKNIEVDQ